MAKEGKYRDALLGARETIQALYDDVCNLYEVAQIHDAVPLDFDYYEMDWNTRQALEKISQTLGKFLYYPGIDKWVPIEKGDYCEKCGQLYAIHNDDGSCVED